jgi:hypothetical protein
MRFQPVLGVDVRPGFGGVLWAVVFGKRVQDEPPEQARQRGARPLHPRRSRSRQRWPREVRQAAQDGLLAVGEAAGLAQGTQLAHGRSELFIGCPFAACQGEPVRVTFVWLPSNEPLRGRGRRAHTALTTCAPCVMRGTSRSAWACGTWRLRLVVDSFEWKGEPRTATG